MSVLIYEKRDQVAYITLNRPEVLNAIDSELNEALRDAFQDYWDDSSLLVAILSGAGRAFSAGADVKAMAAKGISAGEQYDVSPLEMGVWKPIIAAIDGFCLAGGFTLATQCDIRIATERSKFGIVAARVGAGVGPMTLCLGRMVPFGEALYLQLTGSQITAEKALSYGLLNKVVSSREDMMKEAEAVAEEIKLCAPLAVQAAKRLNYASMMWEPEHVKGMVGKVRQELSQTEDAKEGPLAFAEKRRPVWKMR